MKKLLTWMLILASVLLIFASCSKSDGYAEWDSNSGESWNRNPSASSDPDKVMQDVPDVERKIIKTFRVTLEALDYERVSTLVVSVATEMGGYVAASEESSVSLTSSGGTKRNASYTIRVPAANAEAYLDRLAGESNVLSRRLTTEDITDSYYGYKAQLDSLLMQEARLNEMLKSASTLYEMIELEDKLTQVRADINAINSRLQLMDKSVDYSYVYITLTEVEQYRPVEKDSYFTRVGNAFVNGFKSFVKVLGEVVIIVVRLLPYLIVAGVIAVIAVMTSRKNRQKRERKGQSIQNNQTNVTPPEKKE